MNHSSTLQFAICFLSGACCGCDSIQAKQERGNMASVLQRSVKLSASVTRPVAAAVSASVQQQVVATRGFATAQKKKKSVAKKSSKKGNEDANFELMLRNIKGRYPEAYVHRALLCICTCMRA